MLVSKPLMHGRYNAPLFFLPHQQAVQVFRRTSHFTGWDRIGPLAQALSPFAYLNHISSLPTYHLYNLFPPNSMSTHCPHLVCQNWQILCQYLGLLFYQRGIHIAKNLRWTIRQAFELPEEKYLSQTGFGEGTQKRLKLATTPPSASSQHQKLVDTIIPARRSQRRNPPLPRIAGSTN